VVVAFLVFLGGLGGGFLPLSFPAGFLGCLCPQVFARGSLFCSLRWCCSCCSFCFVLFLFSVLVLLGFVSLLPCLVGGEPWCSLECLLVAHLVYFVQFLFIFIFIYIYLPLKKNPNKRRLTSTSNGFALSIGACSQIREKLL